MAQPELDKLFKLRNDLAEFDKIFKNIIEAVGNSRDYFWTDIIKKIAERQDKHMKELADYEKYALCDHIKGEEQYTGHDSHKDYYEVRCKKCKMIIEEYSI